MRSTIRKSKPLQAALLSAAAVAATLGVTATPVQAASSSCTAPYWYGWTRQCTTGSVPANSSGHFVDVAFYACSGVPWKVWDTQTGVTVASGKSPGRSSGWVSKRIYGLYGSSYKAKIWEACAYDQIKVDNNY